MTIEDEVFEFVAEHRGVRREKLKLSDRLKVDLGMDGDDAVEFFEEFEKQFEVDLSYMGEHWGEYFGPEGVAGSGVFFVALIGVIPAVILGALFHLATWEVTGIALVILFGSLFVMGARNSRLERENPTSRQISIANLIAMAKQKDFVHD